MEIVFTTLSNKGMRQFYGDKVATLVHEFVRLRYVVRNGKTVCPQAWRGKRDVGVAPACRAGVENALQHIQYEK